MTPEEPALGVFMHGEVMIYLSGLASLLADIAF
jgi:hypothetical protein